MGFIAFIAGFAVGNMVWLFSLVLLAHDVDRSHEPKSKEDWKVM